ncbi:MAG: hypothetical protein AAF226_06970 [Verrucomicrobiota bacterium]
MKLTPHAQELADAWLARGYDSLDDLAEILGIQRGGIGAEVEGHCYRRVDNAEFKPDEIEEFIDDDERLEALKLGKTAPSSEEIEAWRRVRKDAQPATHFYIWRVPFTQGYKFIVTIHRKNGYIDQIDGPFHSTDAAMPYGDIELR